jgi:hypothetical protein
MRCDSEAAASRRFSLLKAEHFPSQRMRCGGPETNENTGLME